MKKNNGSFIWHRDTLYGQQFVVVLTKSYAKFREIIKKRLNIDMEEEKDCEPSGQFREFTCPENNMSLGVIWSSDQEGALLHECLHACAYVLQKRGIWMDSEGSEETWAYYLSYLWQTIRHKAKFPDYRF